MGIGGEEVPQVHRELSPVEADCGSSAQRVELPLGERVQLRTGSHDEHGGALLGTIEF